MENEFVVADPAKINVAGNTIRTTDHIIKLLGETAKSVAETQAELANAFDAIADLVQIAVMHHTGVDVRRKGGPATDIEIGEIALNSLRTNLGCVLETEPGTNDDVDLRNRMQLVTSGIRLYQDALAGEDKEGAAEILQQTFCVVDSIAKSVGAIESSAMPMHSEQSILLVEQDRQERELLQTILTNHRFDVRSFDNDEAALQFILSHPQDTTMIWNVRHLDAGRAMISRIRSHARGKDISLLGISSIPRNELDIELGPNGVQGWLQKPFDPEVLLRALHSRNALKKAA